MDRGGALGRAGSCDGSGVDGLEDDTAAAGVGGLELKGLRDWSGGDVIGGVELATGGVDA